MNSVAAGGQNEVAQTRDGKQRADAQVGLWQMRIETSVEILRHPDAIWPVMLDVERWPEWTSSISKLERLDPGPFGLGSRVRIRQPRLSAMTWRVSEFEPERFFTWESQSPGVYTIGRHEIRRTDTGSIVTLTVIQAGWLASLIAPFFAALTQRYVHIEAQGLKKRCEEMAAATR